MFGLIRYKTIVNKILRQIRMCAQVIADATLNINVPVEQVQHEWDRMYFWVEVLAEFTPPRKRQRVMEQIVAIKLKYGKRVESPINLAHNHFLEITSQYPDATS